MHPEAVFAPGAVLSVTIPRALADVLRERDAQDRQFGHEHDDTLQAAEWLGVLGVHLSRAHVMRQAVADFDAAPTSAPARLYRDQVVKVAAIALAHAQALDRAADAARDADRPPDAPPARLAAPVAVVTPPTSPDTTIHDRFADRACRVCRNPGSCADCGDAPAPARPGPVCEGCYTRGPADTLAAGWDLVWGSYVCPECQAKAKAAGLALPNLRGGQFAPVGRDDPRANPWAGVPIPR